MPISHIYSFLVHPSRNVDPQPTILGTRVPNSGRLFDMLSLMFDEAEAECDIEIIFRSTGASQTNECRTALVAHLSRPRVNSGRAIAARLQAVTTNRSGLGLFFVVSGPDGGRQRLMLSRFPADYGVLAEERRGSLSVEFVERVFMKNAKAYKSATYVEEAASAGFWKGRAVDRQNSEARGLSNYWISDFLESNLETSAKAGSKRLALAMRQAIRSAGNPDARTELLHAAKLLRGLEGKRISAERVGVHFGLQPAAVEALKAALPRPDLFDQTFELDMTEFNRWAAFRSVELDNGGVLTAPDATFDDVFHREDITTAAPVAGSAATRVRYTTEGAVVREQLRKSK